LNHGDCVILGYAHAYRVCIPTIFDINMDAQSMARKKLDNMEVSVAMAEVEEQQGESQFKEIMPFLNSISSKAPEDSAKSLMTALQAILPLLDEGNQMTRDIFGEGTIKFCMQVLTDLFNFETAAPQLSIAVIADANAGSNVKRTVERDENGDKIEPPKGQKPSVRGSLVPLANMDLSAKLGIDAPKNEDQLLYVWTVEKFIRRLNEMRDLYQQGTDHGDEFAQIRKELRANPYANPWREPIFADVKLLSEQAKDPAGAAAERFKRQQAGLDADDGPANDAARFDAMMGAPPADKWSQSKNLQEASKEKPARAGLQESLGKGDTAPAVAGLEAFVNENAQMLPAGADSSLDETAPEVQRLRVELAACRTAADEDPDDFTLLLDRLEGLVNHLAKGEGRMNAAKNDKSAQSSAAAPASQPATQPSSARYVPLTGGASPGQIISPPQFVRSLQGQVARSSMPVSRTGLVAAQPQRVQSQLAFAQPLRIQQAPLAGPGGYVLTARDTSPGPATSMMRVAAMEPIGLSPQPLLSYEDSRRSNTPREDMSVRRQVTPPLVWTNDQNEYEFREVRQISPSARARNIAAPIAYSQAPMVVL